MVVVSELNVDDRRLTSAARPGRADGADRISMDAFDYGLPASAIAQLPLQDRAGSRLVVAPGLADNPEPEDATITDLPRLLRPGDVLVVNDTRVLTARLQLRKSSGGRAEVLLLEPSGPGSSTWEALVRPGRRLPEGTLLHDEHGGPPVVEIGPRASGARDRCGVHDADGRRLVQLLDRSVVERTGTAPLPPYVHLPLGDPDRYQTVYARSSDLEDRSAAAPTAGLHFTEELLADCRRAGAELARVDLAIGLDTFRPITAATAEEHVIHSERYSVPPETMAACAAAGRVVAVGTTVVRALETAAATGLLSGRTRLFIHGRFRFRMVDVLVTNFHLPRSSLLLLVEAFYGPRWRELYSFALARGYRFLSFGDAMVIGRDGGRLPLGQPVKDRTACEG
jgi:S-adenosylmethionine:tRNA ribosyltransferase-isomerase